MKHFIMSAREIADRVKGTIVGNAERTIESVASVKEADEKQLSFIGNRKYEHLLNETHAGILLVCKDLPVTEQEKCTYIVCDNVDYAFAAVTALFAEEPPADIPGIHPSAVVAPDAVVGKNVSVGANAVIESGAVIGDDTVIGPLCYIGHQVKIGSRTKLYPQVTVMYRCVIGNQVIIHSGAVVGADGFGFVPGPQGLVKIPQTGYVQIDDDVEIGANTTIDRARFGRTWVKRNVKIDDQVMVAHNVVVGESSILVAQCGIAGSAELGRGVILAGKSGVNGHITVGDGTQLAGTSNLAKGTEPGAIMLGTPAEPQRDFLYRFGLPKKVKKLEEKIKELTALVQELRK